ncbi:uncharacterized protein LOC142588196 isoform X1 [Dermacentor variabilis]|uniref:uncharacterized protein LOC142588196 isoform X1 n=1 Tax=Dermacentor variabilis TaxID=34621 RepID=UPI003F5C964B
MASTAQSRKRRDGDSSSTPSSSSTSDSTSTTMFDVTKAAFTTTTTSEEDESSRQVVQKSSSEIEVNLQQDPAAMGVTSQSLPGPSAFNVFLPMGRSVPVTFTNQGICIPGYNAPAAAMEAEEEVTTSMTTTEQQQQAQGAPVAGIFQLLPAGSYLPTFVNMEQLEDEENECDEDEKPTEEYDEVQEEAGPAAGIVEATVHERETFVKMQGPLQGETMGTIGWPQPAAPTFSPLLMPPPMSPTMSPPVPQTLPPPMYATMQAAQSYMPQQYGMLPPFGWQAQMMQSQDQAQAYGQSFGMMPQQAQWPAYQPFWPGMQWPLGQSQWLQSQYMQEGSQMVQQQRQQQQPQQEPITDQLQQDILLSRKRGQSPIRLSGRVRSRSLPCQISREGLPSQTSLTKVEVQAHLGSLPCTVHQVLSTQTSLQHLEPVSKCVSAESMTYVDTIDKLPGKEGRIEVSQVIHVSSDQLATDATHTTQPTLRTETCPIIQELQSKKVPLGHHAANVPDVPTNISSQVELRGQRLEPHCVSRGAQMTSAVSAAGTACADGTTQISTSALRVFVSEVPYKQTGNQAVQTLSFESVTALPGHATRTISFGQHSGGIQTDVITHSTSVPTLTVGLNPQQQRDFTAQHGGVFQPSQEPLMLPEGPHCDIEVQCNYEPFVHTTTNIAAVKVEQKYEPFGGHQEAFVQCNYEPFDAVAKDITTTPRPLHDIEVQFGHDPVKKDFTKDIQAQSEQPVHDFGIQCVYEPDSVMTRTIFRAERKPMHDFEQQHNYDQVDWHARDVYTVQERPMQDIEQQHVCDQKNYSAKSTYAVQSIAMQDFGVQHDVPVTVSPPPTTAHVLYGMVGMGVGDSRPQSVVEGHRRFPQGPVSRVRSRPSVSSCASSVFMFGHLDLPCMANAGTQAGEMGRHRLSPTFAVSAPRAEAASYPCIAVCSRNTVSHPCTLNVSSYPGRLSQSAQTRDAIFQTEEPVAVRAPTIDARSRSLSREPATRTPLREAAVQTFAGSPAPRTMSPPSSPSYHLGPFGTSPLGSSRCTLPARDAGLQTEGFADARRSPFGGPFQHDELVGRLAQATRGLGHGIMIQASSQAPAAACAWSPSKSQYTSAAAAAATMTEVYPCGHLPQVLQMRETPPSPPPLSPPPHSPPPCPCLAGHGWAPVVVEQKIGVGGNLAQLLMLRKQQGLTPEQPVLEEKGTFEEPLAGPVWGSADGEQEYGDQGSSQIEQSSGVGEYSATGAVLGAAGLVPDASGVPGTVRRSSIETTSNVTRSTKVAAILPEVTVACFLLALLLVLVASAALLSWTTRRHARIVLAGQTTKKALHPSNATFIIPPFSALQTIDSSLHVKFTAGTGSHTSHGPPYSGLTTPGPGTYELCTTEFCMKEGQMLRYLRNSDKDPCKDFYEYVCSQWASQQLPGASYMDADGALATEIEARMVSFLNGPDMSSIRPLFTFWTNCNHQAPVPQDRALSHMRALGLELPGPRAPTSPERLMVLAVTLAQEFGLFALVTVELDSDPEGKVQHVLAVDEPELAWGRMKPPLVTTEHTMYWDMLIRTAQPLASLLLSDVAAIQSAAHSFARITMAMTNVSVAHRHISDRMGLYEMHSYQELNRLHPLLNGLFVSNQYLRPSSRLLVKAPRFVDLVYKLLATDRKALHQYMVLLALLHLAPFLDVPDASSAFLGSLTGETVTWGTPLRWRVCLRLAERTLPNLMQVAYEQVFKGSPIFDEVMGDIMVDEVRNGLVEFIDSLSILDAWSKIIAKIKVRDTKVYTFYPIVLADPKNLNAYVKKLERSVTWEGDIMEYYIRLRGFLAQMKEQDETLNFFLPRWKHSIFDPECVYYPRRDVVYVPVGFFNLSVPTSPAERMFHVPRAGPRLIGCFFRVILENTGLYKPEGLWWTEATRAAFQESMACLEEKRDQMVLQHRGIDLHDVSRRLNLQGLSDIEDNVAVRVSVKVYDDRLFTNRYLNRDYRLPGVEHLSSRQLFFIYLARSHCEAPSVEKSIEDIRCSYKSKGRYRTNLALSNNREFADAFQCASGTEMNPTTQCSVWS